MRCRTVGTDGEAPAALLLQRHSVMFVSKRGRQMTYKYQPLHLNSFTYRTAEIQLLRGPLQAQGSGFLFHHRSGLHLVTAWHNVTGRNFIDKKAITPGCWLPSQLKIRFALEHVGEGEGAKEVQWFDFTTRLYFDEDEEHPIWRVHEEFRSSIDLAVISLSVFLQHPALVTDAQDRQDLVELLSAVGGNLEPQYIPSIKKSAAVACHVEPDFLNVLEIAQDVFVVGYPQAITGGFGTPIWKRGSVASEPALPFRDLPGFLIDSATRPGLSGSPVVAKFENPTWDHRGGKLTLQGSRLGLCGLYTFRLTGDVDSAQLGMVWSVAAIKDTIDNGAAGLSANNFSALLDERLKNPII